MLNTLKPTIIQAIMTIMLTVGITNHVFIIPALLQSALRDAWVAVLISGIPKVSFMPYTPVFVTSSTLMILCLNQSSLNSELMDPEELYKQYSSVEPQRLLKLVNGVKRTCSIRSTTLYHD
ncbi:hypothetical protein D3C76_759840 [compost metagenome]